MSEPVATMKPLRIVLKFPFRGANWQGRFATGVGLVLAGFVVPIVPLVFVYGYGLRVMRQAIEGQEPELPAWDNWGQMGADGLGAILISLAYVLPGTLVLWAGMGLYMVATLGASLLASAGDDAGVMLFPLVMMVSMGIMFVSMFLGMLLSLAGLVPLPAAVARYAAHGKLGEAFRLRRLLKLMRANWLDYVLAGLLAMGLSATLYLAFMLVYSSVVLCCLLPLLAAPAALYLQLVLSALYGKVYRDSVAATS